jgi:LysM repeat protein
VKRKISVLLTVLLVLTSSLVYAEEGSGTKTDTTTSATTKVEETTSKPTPPQAQTTTPAATNPAPATAVSTANQIHIVVDGDTMWGIARKYNLSLDDLVTLNPQIKNPKLIFPGNNIVVKVVVQQPVAATPTPTSTPNTTKLYQGLGHTVAFRNGPGKDSKDVPVYSFNIVMASATFDANGKIMNVYLDGYEVSTPNYDGASMPHFSGWPDKEGYNVTDHETEKVAGVSVNTKESAAAEVSAWKTKRERGDSYGMNPANEWYKQMDFFQKFFIGKTVAELQDWYKKNTTSAGRPIKSNTTNQQDLEKLAKLTDQEKAILADVVSGASMSVSDAHGDFIGAIANAYANRVEVVIPVK